MDVTPSLRIALLYHSFRVHGGAEQLVLSLAAGLARRGHTVVVFTRDYDVSEWGEPMSLGFEVRRIYAPNDYSDAASFRDWAKTGRRMAPDLVGFDVIVSNIVPSMMWWHYACESEPRLRETAAVWYCHGFVGWFDPGISGTHVVASALDAGSSHRVSTGSKIASRLRTEGPLWVAQRMIRQILTPASAQSTVRTRELERQIVPTFDRVLANSAFTGEGVCAAFGVEAVTCHPGINVGDELGLGGTDRDGILVLARLDPSKNVIAVLSALEVLRDNGTVPFGRCTIAGSGPAEDDLRSFCAARGLDSLVDFVGAVSGAEKEQLYDCAALFVLPCLDEGFGLVFVEAADHGVPAIGPLHGGPSEIIVPGDTGWLVDELDPAALAAAILEAFSDRGRLAAFGKAARERAREVFSVEAFVRRFEAALDDAVRSKSDTRAGLIRG